MYFSFDRASSIRWRILHLLTYFRFVCIFNAFCICWRVLCLSHHSVLVAAFCIGCCILYLSTLIWPFYTVYFLRHENSTILCPIATWHSVHDTPQAKSKKQKVKTEITQICKKTSRSQPNVTSDGVKSVKCIDEAWYRYANSLDFRI